MPSLDLTPLNPGTAAPHGILVPITAAATPVLVWTATSEVNATWDSVFIMLHSNHTDDVLVKVEWNGTGTGNLMRILMPRYSQYIVAPSLRLRNGGTVRVECDIANVLNVTVEAERALGTTEAV